MDIIHVCDIVLADQQVGCQLVRVLSAASVCG
jgi:hypothetical protein